MYDSFAHDVIAAAVEEPEVATPDVVRRRRRSMDRAMEAVDGQEPPSLSDVPHVGAVT